MQLTIPTNLIKASIHCVAKKDIRYYLQGALFEYTSMDKKLRVISTDGNIMSCFSVFYPEGDQADFSVIVPLDTLKGAAKERTPAVTLMQADNGVWLFAGVVFKPVDGRYPDYRRVIPARDSLSGTVGKYDAELLIRAQDAMRDLRKSKNGAFEFVQNGARGPAVMHDGTDDAIVIVMPWQTTKRDDPAPTYAGFN